MKHYSAERKSVVLRTPAPPIYLTVPEVAEAEGIATASLCNWAKQGRERGQVFRLRESSPGGWISGEKFRVVLGTVPMSEADASSPVTQTV